MTRNTAREIFVKKFLEPNPFLKDAVRALPAVRKDNYARARLVFPDADEVVTRPRSGSWGTDRSRVAILSSGGKESLLSHALIQEHRRRAAFDLRQRVRQALVHRA